MAHLIDKDALIAEIDRLGEVQPLDEFQPKEQNKIDWLAGKLFTITSLKLFLDTLEVKEVDLEEKATRLSQKYFPNEENIWARSNIEAKRCKSACIEMVEWLKAAQKG